MTFWQIELVLSVMVIDSNYLVLKHFFSESLSNKTFLFLFIFSYFIISHEGSIFHNFPSFPRTHMSARGRFPV
jgi:hypothetical protein